MLRTPLRLSLTFTFALAACDSSGDGQDDDSDDSTETDDSDSDPVPSDGCGNAVDSGVTNGTLMVGDLARNYILVVPEDYDAERPYPLIFAFHGHGSSPAVSRNYFAIEREASDNAIFVYPEGRTSEGSASLGWDREGPEDYDFFEALRTELGQTLCIDEGRVFATGHSAGGFMTNHLACRLPDLLRAIAPVAGGGPEEGASCEKEMPAWISHGELDETVPFAAGEGTRDYWSQMAGCGAETMEWGNIDECSALTECSVPVVWCPHQEETFGGHWWPTFGGRGVWDFFRQF